MIDVEAPPATSTSPIPRDDVLPWLAIAATAFLATCLLPWERYCTGGSPRFPQQCFAAHVWSGSARFLGITAIMMALGYMVATLRRGLRIDPGIPRLVVFGAFATAAAGKALIVFSNASETVAFQSQVNPASPVVWIGLAVAALGGILLLVVLLRSPRRLASAAVVVTILALTAFGVVYARSGFAWWGGPLAQPAFLGGGNGLGMVIEPGQPDLFFGLIVLHNGSSTDVTLDGLDLVDASPPFRVLGSYVIEAAPCLSSAVDLDRGLSRGQCAYPLPGFVVAPGSPGEGVRVAALVDVSSPGVYRSGWFRVRYHAGVVPFELFRTDQLAICAPEPGRRSCPGGGL